MDSPLVTIICCTYNHEKYIRDTLEGFISQETDFDYEVVVHDDASTDGTSSIVMEYADKYPFIIPVVEKENLFSQGKFRAFINLKEYSSGKYVATCEGDDYWTDPHKLQKQVDFLEAHEEYAMCVHQCERLDCRTGEKALYSMYSEDRNVELEDILSNWGSVYQTATVLVRSDIYFDRPDFCSAIRGVADWPHALYVCGSSKIRFLGNCMSVYRFYSNTDSWTSSQNFASTDRYKPEIEMLNMADEYFDGRFHSLIWPAVAVRKFWISGAEWNKGFLKVDYMREVYSRLPVTEKIKALIKGYCPFISKVYRSIKNGTRNF